MDATAVVAESRSATRCATAGVVIVAAAVVLAAPCARAQEDDAGKILKAMSDYVGSQKTISAAFDSDIEVVTPGLQKIQFASSGQLLLSRPDKLRVSRTGGYADVELILDGKTATIYGRHLVAFAQVPAEGSIDQVVDKLRSGSLIDAPGADLLLSHAYDELMADVLDAKHIGRGVVDGVECEHLAFRNLETDWQIWVAVGDQPIPHKYVITSKTLAGAPQYTLRISKWQANVQVAADAFAFKPPSEARNVDLKALANVDEVPEGTMAGGLK